MAVSRSERARGERKTTEKELRLEKKRHLSGSNYVGAVLRQTAKQREARTATAAERRRGNPDRGRAPGGPRSLPRRAPGARCSGTSGPVGVERSKTRRR